MCQLLQHLPQHQQQPPAFGGRALPAFGGGAQSTPAVADVEGDAAAIDAIVGAIVDAILDAIVAQ